MTIRGVSSHEETIVFYEVHNSHVELQHTTWGTTERITLALNDENNTRVHMNLGCIFSIKPATIVLNNTLTRITIEKMCEMTLKTVGLDNEKYILFPRNVRHLRVILSKSLHQTNITIPTTIKPIMTNNHDYNLTTLDNVEHNNNKNNTNYETISQIIKANLTVEEPTDVANKFDYGDITLDTTEGIEDRTNITSKIIINNTNNTRFVTNLENSKFKIHYYNFIICVGISILIMTIVLLIISIHHNFKCVNRHRYRYVVNLIHEQGTELNVMRETSI